jgi:hypothetical protein
MAMQFGMKGALVAVMLAATTGLFGCDKVADLIGKEAKKQAEKEIAKAAEANGAEPGGTTAGAVNYFADATSVPTKYKEKIGGPTRVLELVLYPEYANAQIQDPNKKLNVDQFHLRKGAVDDGSPVKFMGKQPTEQDLQASTWTFEEVDFTQVPKMAADAVAQLKFEDAKVTHMILQRGRFAPNAGKLGWRVYVNSPRRSGSVEYDTKGTLIKKWE